MAGTITRIRTDGTSETTVITRTRPCAISPGVQALADAALEAARLRARQRQELLNSSSDALRAALLRD